MTAGRAGMEGSGDAGEEEEAWNERQWCRERDQLSELKKGHKY